MFYDEMNRRVQDLIDKARNSLPEKDFEEISLEEVFPGSTALAGLYIPAKDVFVTRRMRWGWPRSDKGTVINGRSETAFASPFFRGAVPVALPASYYYEWSKDPRIRYAFRIAEPCMYLGGLARNIGGVWRFVILTEEAQGEQRQIHDRQPLVFTYEDAKKWCASGHPTSMLSLSVQNRFISKA